MADTPTLPSALQRKRPKSWWLIRCAVVTIVLLSVGYATLPIWLPPEWIARQLMNQLSTSLNRRVHIDRVRLGWIEGVVFEGVTIEDRPGSGVPTLARFGRIRCELEPLTSAMSGRVQELQIDDPAVFLTVDQNGKLNIDDLARQEFRGLPSRNFVVRRLTCHVQTPQGLERVGFESLECRLDHATGVLRLLGQVWAGDAGRGPTMASSEADPADREKTSSRRLSIHAHVTVPRLKRGEKLTGEVHVEWDRLSLRDLPLGLIPRLPFEQVQGTSTGRMTINTQPDLGIDFGLNVVLHGVTVQRGEQGRLPRLPDAEVSGEGHWDPTTDVLELKSLGYETPAIRLAGSTRNGSLAARIDPQGEVPLELHAAGAVKDWSILYREWPRLEDAIRAAGLDLTGGTDFNLDVTRRRDEDRLVAAIDGVRTTCRVLDGSSTLLAVVADIPKTARINLVAGRSVPQRIQPRFEGTLGDLSISGWADFTSPVPWDGPGAKNLVELAREVLPTASGEIEIYSKHIEETLGFLPSNAAAERLRDCRGPVQLGLSCKPEGSDRRIALDVITQVDTRLSCRDLFEKPAGQTLRANATLQVPPASAGRVKDLRIALEYGRSQVTVGPENAQVDYEWFRPGPSGSSSDTAGVLTASWSIGAKASNIEDLLTLWPQWRTLCEAGRDREVTGTAGIGIRGELVWGGPDELLSAGVELTTDQMAVRWDDTLNKPTGVPLAVSASQHARTSRGHQERKLDIALRGKGGMISGSWLHSAAAGGGKSTAISENDSTKEQWRFNADLVDAGEWLRIAPSLARRAAGWDPHGSLVVKADAEIAATQSLGTFSVDATGASFRVPGPRNAEKASGIPMKTAFHWIYRPSPDAAHTGSLALTEGSAMLAGLELSKAAATFDVTEADTHPAEPSTGSWLSPGFARLSLDPVDLVAEGRVSFDDSLRSVCVPVREWCDRTRLEGTARWQGEMHVRPNGREFVGSVDANGLAFSSATENELFPTIRKLVGSPLSLSWDVLLGQGLEEGGHSLLIRDAVVKLEGNEVSTAGTVELGSTDGTTDGIAADLTCHLQLRKPKALVGMMPESWINDLEGQVEAWLGLLKDRNGLRLAPSRVEFSEFVLGTRDQPIELNGAVTLETDGLAFEQLQCEWGASQGVLSGGIRRQDGASVGRIGLAMEHLDISDLQGRLRAVGRNSPTTQPENTGNSQAIVRAVIDQLRSSEIVLDTHFGVLEAVLPPKQTIVADAVAAQTLVQKGPVTINFRGLADGGIITGELVSHTQVSEPIYHLKYTAEDLYPGPLVDGYLRLSFPGMKATGPLTLIDETYQKLLPEAGDPNYEVGEGELIIKGGTVTGRAAPRWMTRYLPGLNLARYDFSYMHSWFKKTPTGRIHHQMIFRGPIYNLYMIGYSDPDRRFEYEVGVDFLADFDSKYWAESGQGRVPLFIKSGLVAEDGALLDERVNFVSIERLAESIFVRNNLVVTAYHALRKRVLGQR